MNRFFARSCFQSEDCGFHCWVLDFQGGACFLEMKQTDCTSMHIFLITCFWAQSCRAIKWRKEDLKLLFWRLISLWMWWAFRQGWHSVCVCREMKWNILARGNFSFSLAAPPCVCHWKIITEIRKGERKKENLIQAIMTDWEKQNCWRELFKEHVENLMMVWTMGW